MNQEPPAPGKPDIRQLILLVSLLVIIVVAIYLLPGGKISETEKAILVENFDGKTIAELENAGWKLWSKSRMSEVTGYPAATYPSEVVKITENGELLAERGAGGLFLPHEWKDFRFQVKFKRNIVTWVGIAFRCDNDWQSQDAWWSNGYLVQLGFEDQVNQLWKTDNGSWTQLSSQNKMMTPNVWHELVIESRAGLIKVWVDNQQLFDVIDPAPILDFGGLALVNNSGPVYFDNLRVEPL